jgi:predicted DNA-binding protein
MENKICSNQLDKDPELKPLLGKGASLLACKCFAHWIRGFSPTHIGLFFGISTEEVESNIALIKQLLPSDVLASQVEIRNEILTSQERTREIAQDYTSDLSLSAHTLLKRGKNPANVLRKIREELTAEIPSQIAALRKQNNQASIDEDAVDLAERDNQLVLKLRARDKGPAKTIMSENRIRHESKSAPPEQNILATNGQDQKPGRKKTDRRITSRMPPGLYEKLRKHSRDTGLDLSTVIREAVSQYLQGDAASRMSQNMEMPQAALERTGRYQVAGSDLKERLRESFLQLLAMAYVTKGCWRADWVKKLYLGLIPLYQHLEPDDVGQFRN